MTKRRRPIYGPSGQAAAHLWRTSAKVRPKPQGAAVYPITLHQMLTLFSAVCRAHGLVLPAGFPREEDLKRLLVVDHVLFVPLEKDAIAFDVRAWLIHQAGDGGTARAGVTPRAREVV